MAKRTIRITVVGDGDTGKTSMLIAYKDKEFSDVYISTVFDMYSMTIPINGTEYMVTLSDTAGQEEYDRLRRLAYTEVDIFIVCYSVNNRDSFLNVQQVWAPELQKFRRNVKLLLVGTKCDLPRVVTYEEAEQLSTQIKSSGYIENSAKEMYNINETFSKALQLYLPIKAPRSKRSTSCVLL